MSSPPTHLPALPHLSPHLLRIGLDQAVLNGIETKEGGDGDLHRKLTPAELNSLLRHGAYGALQDDESSKRFCEEVWRLATASTSSLHRHHLFLLTP